MLVLDILVQDLGIGLMIINIKFMVTHLQLLRFSIQFQVVIVHSIVEIERLLTQYLEVQGSGQLFHLLLIRTSMHEIL